MSNIARIQPGQAPSAQLSRTQLLDATHTDLRKRVLMSSGLPVAFIHGMSPSPQERATIANQIASVRNSLEIVATDDQSAKMVRLLAGGLKASAGQDAEAVAEAYLFVLSGVKLPILELAVKNLLTGKAPEAYSKTFMPSSAELADYCGKLERDAVALCKLTEGLVYLPEAGPPEPPMSEEQMTANRERLKELFKPRRLDVGATDV